VGERAIGTIRAPSGTSGKASREARPEGAKAAFQYGFDAADALIVNASG